MSYWPAHRGDGATAWPFRPAKTHRMTTTMAPTAIRAMARPAPGRWDERTEGTPTRWCLASLQRTHCLDPRASRRSGGRTGRNMPDSPQDLRARRLQVRRRLTATRSWRWRLGQVAGDDNGSGGHTRRHRRWSSRQLHRLGSLASHAWAGVVVLAVALGWIAYGGVIGFPTYWQRSCSPSPPS